MPFWKCYYHVVWSTQHRAELMHDGNKPIIYRAILYQSQNLGCQIHALNAVSDHIHCAVTIPPKLPVSLWVQRVKGISSHDVNEAAPMNADHFAWQKGYGVLTFGRTNLNFVVGYIDSQQQRHNENDVEDYLETVCVKDFETTS